MARGGATAGPTASPGGGCPLRRGPKRRLTAIQETYGVQRPCGESRSPFRWSRLALVLRAYARKEIGAGVGQIPCVASAAPHLRADVGDQAKGGQARQEL